MTTPGTPATTPATAEVRVLPGRGRGLVATQPMAAGHVIATHAPLVAAVAPAWQQQQCAHCFASAYPRKWPLACAGACQLRFCSTTCQDAASHKPDAAPCQARRNLHKRLLQEGQADTVAWTSVAVALVLEALLCPADIWASLMELCCLEEKDLEDALRREMQGIVDVAVACLEEEPPNQEVRQKALALLLRSECNAFSYWSDDGAQDQLGMGLFLEAAMFNHACCPNVGKVLDGRRLRFVALRAIAAGEELSISYVPLDDGTDARRDVLRKHFHFICVCARCTGHDGGEWDEDGYRDAYVHLGCGGSWVPEEEGNYCSLCKQARQ